MHDSHPSLFPGKWWVSCQIIPVGVVVAIRACSCVCGDRHASLSPGVGWSPSQPLPVSVPSASVHPI